MSKKCTFDGQIYKMVKADAMNNYGYSKKKAKNFAKNVADNIANGTMEQYCVELAYAIDQDKQGNLK